MRLFPAENLIALNGWFLGIYSFFWLHRWSEKTVFPDGLVHSYTSGNEGVDINKKQIR
jgi:hypothetical protein